MRAALLVLAALSIALSATVGAQGAGSALRLEIGFGIDTTRSPERDLVTLYRTYLEHRGDRPNPYWSRAEQAQWALFDILSPSIYQGFKNFTLVHVAPVVGLDSTYLLRGLVSNVDDSTHAVRPIALYRLYAVRQEGRWVLANALPRVTRHWRRETIGRVTFASPMARPFDRARATASARFVDSLAHAFKVPPPPNIDYYFADELPDVFAAMGLDFFPLGQETVGGRAFAPNRLVFVASADNGEGYRHELAHVVLWPFLANARAHGLIMEGLMTWVGGSAGVDFDSLLPGLRAYVDKHPELTLEGVLANPPPREGTLDVGYDGMAVLCALVFERAGLEGIRALVNAGAQPTEILTAAARAAGVPRDSLNTIWRRRLRATTPR